MDVLLVDGEEVEKKEDDGKMRIVTLVDEETDRNETFRWVGTVEVHAEG